jgi:hypothetical protein
MTKKADTEGQRVRNNVHDKSTRVHSTPVHTRKRRRRRRRREEQSEEKSEEKSERKTRPQKKRHRNRPTCPCSTLRICLQRRFLLANSITSMLPNFPLYILVSSEFRSIVAEAASHRKMASLEP